MKKIFFLILTSLFFINEHLGVWKNIKNESFNYLEFGLIKKEEGVNRFVMSIGQWVERTDVMGRIVKVDF